MNRHKLDQIIEDGLKSIENEIKQEDDLREHGEYIARMLAMTPIQRVCVANTVYVLSMRMVKHPSGQTLILLAAENEFLKKIHGDHYSPALYTAEYNDMFSLEENCQTLVSTFLGKVTGKMKIEELQDEGSVKVAREKDFK